MDIDKLESQMSKCKIFDGCCISEVPSAIRQAKPEAYTPQTVIIGLIHHHRKAEIENILKQPSTCIAMENFKHRYRRYSRMEEAKRLCVESFQGTYGDGVKHTFSEYITRNEHGIRSSYALPWNEIDSHQLSVTILRDAIFIFMVIEGKFDLMGFGEVNGVRLDLTLLENQLPFFVLEALFLATGQRNFAQRASLLFRCSEAVIDGRMPKHFTDLMRMDYINGWKRREQIKSIFDNAQKLHESGIQFKAIDDHKSDCLPFCFENPKLWIKPLVVFYETESKLRNMMALEQLLYESDDMVCRYALFLDLLIDTKDDADILAEEDIIRAGGEDTNAVVVMLNKLTDGIPFPADSAAEDIGLALMRHRKRPWNRTKTYLKRYYFDNPVKSAATIVAFVLVLLSIIQTATSIIQVVQG